jgi:hypothetical protein
MRADPGQKHDPGERVFRKWKEGLTQTGPLQKPSYPISCSQSEPVGTFSALVGSENAYSIGSRRSNLARFQTEVLQSLRSKWAVNYNGFGYRRVCRVTDGNHRVSRI